MKKLTNLPSGSAGPSKKKKSYLAENKSFLQNFIVQHRKSKGNVTDDSLDDNDNEDNEGTFQETASFQDITGNLDEATTSTEEDNTAAARTSTTISSIVADKAPQVSLSKNRGGKRKPSPADLVALPMIDFLKSRTGQTDNHHMKFFESLIPDLERLSKRRQREFKLQVHSLLYSFIDDQENEAMILTASSRSSTTTVSPLSPVSNISSPGQIQHIGQQFNMESYRSNNAVSAFSPPPSVSSPAGQLQKMGYQSERSSAIPPAEGQQLNENQPFAGLLDVLRDSC